MRRKLLLLHCSRPTNPDHQNDYHEDDDADDDADDDEDDEGRIVNVTLRHRNQAPCQPGLQQLPGCAFANINIMVRLMVIMIRLMVIME